MTLLPGERAANPAHKFLQPDFSTLWWWGQAWNPLALEWFLTGDEETLLKKQGFLSAYNRVNPGDATGKSLPPAEWLVEYYTRVGDIKHENGSKVLRPTGFKADSDSPVSTALLLADYFTDAVRFAPGHGFDYDTSSRAGLLIRTARLSEADWRYLYGVVEALHMVQQGFPSNGRAKYLLADISSAVSANLHVHELTGEGILPSPADWASAHVRATLTADNALATGASNFPEIVRNPSTPEEELEELYRLVESFPTGRYRTTEAIKQSLRWIEAHPNWTAPATSSLVTVEPGEDAEYFIGYDTEMLYPTLFGDAVSELTPQSMRFQAEDLVRSFSNVEQETYGEDDPALWSGTRMIAGHHALVNFTCEEVRPLLMASLANPGDAVETVAAGIMPAFGALLAELVEPYSDEDGIQVPLEWILEISSE